MDFRTFNIFYSYNSVNKNIMDYILKSIQFNKITLRNFVGKCYKVLQRIFRLHKFRQKIFKMSHWGLQQGFESPSTFFLI